MTRERRHRLLVNAAGLPLVALGVVPLRAAVLMQLAPGMGPSSLEYTLGGVVVAFGILYLLYSRLDKHLEDIRKEEAAAREAQRVAFDHRLDLLQRLIAEHGERDARDLGATGARIDGLIESVARLREDFNGIGSRITNQVAASYEPRFEAAEQRDEALEARFNRLELRFDGLLALLRKESLPG